MTARQDLARLVAGTEPFVPGLRVATDSRRAAVLMLFLISTSLPRRTALAALAGSIAVTAIVLAGLTAYGVLASHLPVKVVALAFYALLATAELASMISDRTNLAWRGFRSVSIAALATTIALSLTDRPFDIARLATDTGAIILLVCSLSLRCVEIINVR